MRIVRDTSLEAPISLDRGQSAGGSGMSISTISPDPDRSRLTLFFSANFFLQLVFRTLFLRGLHKVLILINLFRTLF